LHYVEYHATTGEVIQIHEKPTSPRPNYYIAVSEQLTAGMEIEHSIKVLEVEDDNNTIVSYSAVRNNPNAQRLLKENEELQNRLVLAEDTINFLLGL
jgi:hypothetical protein